jgi:hypothetical protein
MSVEKVLENDLLVSLRNSNIISENEVAISTGDLYYAKNILTNEKRMLDKSVITNINTAPNLSESTNKKTLLKG